MNNRRRLFFIVACALASVAVCPAQDTSATGQQNRIDGLLIFTVGSEGVWPKTIEVSEGSYVLRVRDQGGYGAVSVALEREVEGAAASKTSVSQSAITPGKSGVQRLVKLDPGKHTLTLGGNPKWTSTIAVTARMGKQ
jgi:hypothetical protein